MLVLVLLSVLAVALGEEQPPISHHDRHTLKLECPRHAVCADVYSFRRNGRPERRALYNCHCSGQEGRCQLDEARMLHETVKHRMFFCESMATVPQCSDDDQNQVAEEIVRNSPDFEYNAYVKVKCQCPRHSAPVEPEPGHIERAVTWYGNRQDVLRHIYFQTYVCARGTREYFNRFRPDLNGHSGK